MSVAATCTPPTRSNTWNNGAFVLCCKVGTRPAIVTSLLLLLLQIIILLARRLCYLVLQLIVSIISPTLLYCTENIIVTRQHHIRHYFCILKKISLAQQYTYMIDEHWILAVQRHDLHKETKPSPIPGMHILDEEGGPAQRKLADWWEWHLHYNPNLLS